MKKKVLIIDDEELIRLSLKEGLKDFNYEVETAKDGNEAIDKINYFRPDIILLDMKLKGENGLDIAQSIKKIDDAIEIIIMTAYGDIKTAIKAIKVGATDYLKKPLDLDEVNVSISKALKNQSIKRKLEIYEKRESKTNHELIGESKVMEDTIKKINILSKNDSVTVLIRGETGTGKEVVASSIHQNSIRKDSVMLSINCATIPSQLLESELFGFEKNSFSGANSRKKGLLELAHGGTLFLDELGEIPLDIQTKLLRFLETRKFKRIGGLEYIEVDIRIIAATNKDLEEAIRKKEFRQDLYYRLNVVPIFIPPLREREEDILKIAKYFLHIYSNKFGKSFAGFSKKAENQLMKYYWPGNVRELKNIVERIVILNDGEVLDVENLPIELQNNPSTKLGSAGIDDFTIEDNFSLEDKISEIERIYIKRALDEAKGNHTNASKLLGISRFALKRRMEKYFD
ncbi:MAG: sigma-54 dependent transcriptional regulator [Anaeromicrobium sp.]|jgi:two-component system response regulator AtoC|uniref:sigma-54-dependent transcriptional regulator n=1 Tax=Anaeromicrobium sp. TaxID=1929132 RepID=UPI0025FA5D03|nr:sigma-54 dependent transcriptional regulator [Anaeromicrobium sp.]MCT4593839.1 sigma-54 dependent transcriptional regulator [Anaeromicrobium sp.]